MVGVSWILMLTPLWRGGIAYQCTSPKECDVMPYSDEYEAKKLVPIAQVATGYTTADGNRFILIVN